ncbi:enoyl-CoA hydratase/isomerase family protein [Chloroflexota bacterium]
MGYQTIIIERQGNIGILTLNRPSKNNALNTQLYKEIALGLIDFEKSDEVHVLLIRSNGKNFCVGRDLSETHSSTWERRRNAKAGGFAKLASLLSTVRKPVIAAVQGAAVAGGCGLALSCDLVIASEDARFGVTAINVGLFCFGPSVPLCRSVGRKKSLELLLTGDLIDATEAKKIGLVNHVVPRERLEEAAMELANKLADKSPIAIQMGKQSFYAMADMEYAKALAYSEDLGLILASTPDAEEGIKAFLEKRTPNWKGN